MPQKSGLSEVNLHVKWPANAKFTGLSRQGGCSREVPLKRGFTVYVVNIVG